MTMATTPLQLTGEQHNVLTLPPQGPVLIRGAAGSGKTTVAILRAQHLLRTHSPFPIPPSDSALPPFPCPPLS
jgi:ATP-dependent exoDNAse (exonuclease V) beta subunit